MPQFVAQKAQFLLDAKGITSGKVAVLGLAFKGDVDDMRESPSIKVIEALQERGLEVKSFDPHIKELQHTTQQATLEEATEDADLIILTTDHTDFKQLSPNSLTTKQPKPFILDTKNALSREKWEQAGFHYFKLGDGSPVGVMS
jgi:UDP-N-acetyl-D-mannosaminuronic acid dehydrogenase